MVKVVVRGGARSCLIEGTKCSMDGKGRVKSCRRSRSSWQVVPLGESRVA